MQRQSNLELLRIFAMLMIVMGHCAFAVEPAHRDLAVRLLSHYGRMAVNLFLIIGCWFMVDRPAGIRKIVQTYLAAAVTTVSLTLVALVVGWPAPMQDVLRGFMPFFGRPLWFVSAYLCLMAASPFLCRVFKWEAHAQRIFIPGVFLTTSLICTMPDSQLAYVADVFWFGCVFLMVGWLKHSFYLPKTVRRFRWAFFTVGFGGYLLLTLLPLKVPALASVFGQWLFDFKTLPNAVLAFAAFMFFLSLDLGVNRIVNFIASGALGVYMLHEVPAFKSYLWNGLFHLQDVRAYAWAWVLLAAVAVYAAGLVYERLRRRFVDGPVMGSKWMGRLVSTLERWAHGS